MQPVIKVVINDFTDIKTPRFNCLYGTLGILDKLHKTDKPFAGSVHEKRHYISYSLTPIKQIHPEPVRGAGKAGKSGKAE